MNAFSWNRTVALAALALCASCSSAQTYKLAGSPKAPGADAQLEVEPIEANTEVRLNVSNLLPPARVDGAAKHYAVWIKPPERHVVHLGNLAYDKGDRKGLLNAMTPHRNFGLTITAESDKTPAEPTGPTILEQAVHVN